MSTLTITPLVPGETASAADHNANVTAWEAATAANAIDDDNVREEGIDTVNLVDETVEAFGSGTGDWFFESDNRAGPYGAGVSEVLMGGTDPVKVGGLVILADDDVIIRCSAWCRAVAPASDTKMILRYSTDDVTYSNVGMTRRPMSQAAVGCQMHQTYTVTHRHAYGAGTFYYKLYVEDSAGADVYVENAVLWAQMVRK